MLDEECPIREEVVPQVPAGAGEEATPAAPRAPGSIEPDMVVEQVMEETADGEITCLYDSANDPSFCPARPSEPTPEEVLAQLLTRGQAMTESFREPPSHHEDEQSVPKRRSRSRSRGLSAGENQNEPKAEPPRGADKLAKKLPPLNWIPGPEEEFPVHLAIGTKTHAFILWAENYKLNPECYEVQALQFIPNHVEVTGKIVAWVMWALVYGMMGERHLVPDRIVGLEGTGPHEQSPAGATFPTRPEGQDDL